MWDVSRVAPVSRDAPSKHVFVTTHRFSPEPVSHSAWPHNIEGVASKICPRHTSCTLTNCQPLCSAHPLQYELLDDSGPWWTVRSDMGEQGIVPSNYVEVVAGLPPAPLPQAPPGYTPQAAVQYGAPQQLGMPQQQVPMQQQMPMVANTNANTNTTVVNIVVNPEKGMGKGDGSGETTGGTKDIMEMLEWNWHLKDTYMCLACCCIGYGCKKPEDGWCANNSKTACMCVKSATTANCCNPSCLCCRFKSNVYCPDCCYEDEANPGQFPLCCLPKCFCWQCAYQQKDCCTEWDSACACGACGATPGKWELDCCRAQVGTTPPPPETLLRFKPVRVTFIV